MTMNSSVFRAILALDSYNRGYRPGVKITASTEIGMASIIAPQSFGITPSELADWQGVGFYAAAYRWNGETIISYRGTDFDLNRDGDSFWERPAVRDIFSGWSLGAGFAGPGQPALAIDFYRAVTGVNSVYALLEDQPSVTLLGHSLGGGLAGFVGGLSGQTVWGYDHMPFSIGMYAQAIVDSLRAASDVTGAGWNDVLNVLSGVASPSTIITGILTLGEFIDEFNRQYAERRPYPGGTYSYLDGEILASVRDGTLQPLISGAVGSLLGFMAGAAGSVAGIGLGLILGAAGFPLAAGTAYFESQLSANYVNYGVYDDGTPMFTEDLTALQRHSMALLVTTIFGEQQFATERPDLSAVDWNVGLRHIEEGFFSREIGEGLRLVRGSAGTGFADPQGQMATMIAYSAVNEGTRPFGDTGIRAMFDDLANLGRSIRSIGAPVALESGADGIGRVVTEFAGLLAVEKIESADSPDALNGILTYRNATEARSATLMIDLRQATTWDIYGRDHSIVSTDNMIEGFIQADVNEGRQILNRIERFYADANGGQDILAAIDRVSISLGGNLPVARLPGDGVLLTVLSDDGNTSSYTARTDFVIGGEGGDIISGLGGDDILIGGRGGDVLDGGNGRDFLYGGTGGDILYGGEGGDELWSGPADLGGVISLDELYGEGGADRLNFVNGGGVAIGGAGNDVIDARNAAAEVQLRYSLGDGSDRLLYAPTLNLSFDIAVELFRTPTAGPVSVNFLDLSLADVVIRWDIGIIDSRTSDTVAGGYDSLCVGVMRVFARDGTELMNLGEVSGIVTRNPVAGSTYFSAFNHPALEFTDGWFTLGEGANAEFNMVITATPAAADAGASLADADAAPVAAAFLPQDEGGFGFLPMPSRIPAEYPLVSAEFA